MWVVLVLGPQSKKPEEKYFFLKRIGINWPRNLSHRRTERRWHGDCTARQWVRDSKGFLLSNGPIRCHRLSALWHLVFLSKIKVFHLEFLSPHYWWQSHQSPLYNHGPMSVSILVHYSDSKPPKTVRIFTVCLQGTRGNTFSCPTSSLLSGFDRGLSSSRLCVRWRLSGGILCIKKER